MAVLLVKFAEDLNLPDYTIYHVEESDARVAQDVELIIQNATPIHYGDARIVYKGELSRGNLAQTEEIVLKLVVARHEDARPALENEYSFYCNQLKDLQGTAVPKCYGMFKDPNESHFALVLQYCGEPACSEDFKSPFQQINTRLDIVDHLLELHERGVQHGDFADRNIVINKDGKPFIIDFEHAEDHKCERTEDVIEGALAPGRRAFGCSEIFDFCFDHYIWRSGSFYFVGICIPEDRATSPEDTFKAAREFGASVNDDILWDAADNVYKLAEAIKANGGLMPRPRKLKALGVVGNVGT